MKVIMKRCIFALSVVIVLVSTAGFAFAQQTWQRNYGGVDEEEGWSVQQTSDGGYIVAGYTRSFGNSDQVYLIKTNALGDTLWSRTYGGGQNDYGYDVQQTQDGGYVVAGYTGSFGFGDLYLIKTNASGDTIWTKSYGGDTLFDYGWSVQQTSDMGYIVAGGTESFGNNEQVYLIKTNASGDTLWTRNYGGTSTDEGYSVQQTTDGGYIVAGYTYTSGGNGYQVYLIKTNATGDTLWTRTYGGTGYDVGRSVQQTSDGGYIVAGYYDLFTNPQVYVVKTNATGNTLWTRTYGGTSYDRGYSVQQTTDGGYIVAGLTYTSGGNGYQVYLVKTNASGDTLWTRTHGGATQEEGYSVRQTSDGGYIVAGVYDVLGNPQVYLVKTNANGTIGIDEEDQRSKIKDQKYRITPNPFASFATVSGHERESFALFDVSGRQVGVFRGDRIGVGLAAGVYFIKAEDHDVLPVRVVKVR